MFVCGTLQRCFAGNSGYACLAVPELRIETALSPVLNGLPHGLAPHSRAINIVAVAAKGNMSVLLETSAGDVVVDLLVDYAPKACER